MHTDVCDFEVMLGEVTPSKHTTEEYKEYVARHPFRIWISTKPLVGDDYDLSIMTNYDGFYEYYFEKYQEALTFFNALDDEKIVQAFNFMASEMYRLEMTKRGLDQTLDTLAERITDNQS